MTTEAAEFPPELPIEQVPQQERWQRLQRELQRLATQADVLLSRIESLESNNLALRLEVQALRGREQARNDWIATVAKGVADIEASRASYGPLPAPCGRILGTNQPSPGPVCCACESPLTYGVGPQNSVIKYVHCPRQECALYGQLVPPQGG